MRWTRLRALAGFAWALGLGACSGPRELSLGVVSPPETMAVFIAPNGDDSAPGTRDRPIKTFKQAWTQIIPGGKLTLLKGFYDHGTGYLDVSCGAEVPATLTDITVAADADYKRGALLQGDGSSPPVRIAGCKGWTILDLHVEARDNANAPGELDAGSLVVVGSQSEDITLRGLIALRPNTARRADVIHVADGASRILVEDCELYDFHQAAIDVTRANTVTLRRNFINPRGWLDATTGKEAQETVGVVLEETRNVTAENNILEDVHDGFELVGRGINAVVDPTAANIVQISNNQVLGNVVLDPVTFGIRIDSSCQGHNPCIEREHQVVNTVLEDNVVVHGAAGVSAAGAINTQIKNLSIIDAENGVLVVKEPQNVGIPSTTFTSSSLVANYQNVGFKETDEKDWNFLNCAVSGGIDPAQYDFQPNDLARAANPLMVGDLGGCLAYLLPSSPLQTAGLGGTYVGAKVINRYQDGILTDQPLWDRDTGAFPCGPATDVNPANAATSCMTVHRRLNVTAHGSPPAPTSCPLP